MKLKSGKKLQIHSYKHDGSLHRVWLSTFVIEDTMDFLVTGNQATKVIEHDGRSWYTKEPAICYFFEKEWFNIIAMMKKDGIHYYCNISSPYVYDGEAIKYIDYDLDIKIYPNGKMMILDQKDYDDHSNAMSYPEDVKHIIDASLETLKSWIRDKKPPFEEKTALNHYTMFKELYAKAKQKAQKHIKAIKPELSD